MSFRFDFVENMYLFAHTHTNLVLFVFEFKYFSIDGISVKGILRMHPLSVTFRS